MDHPMTQRLEELAERRELARNAGSPRAVEKHHAKGKMTARERIDYLLDDGSFQELDMLARHRAHGMGLEENRPYTDGVITGFGTVEGRRVCVFSQDFTVFGGALGEVFAEKIHKVMDLASSIGVPMIGLNDGAGARIQEGVVSLHSYGGIFHRNAQASGVIPQISVILGPCAGGAVYSPAMTDFIFMVQGTSHMFITGPDVVKTVTGEDVTLEELGGAMSHATKSGVAAFVSPDEKACLDDVRYLLSFLPSNNLEEAPLVVSGDDPERLTPELTDLMPASPNQPYDMKKVIEAVVDDGEFFEVWSAGSPGSTDGRSESSGTSPRCWPVSSTSTPRRRGPGSSARATPSTSPSSPSSTFPASCREPTRSTGASSVTAPSCSTPTASPPSHGSRSSPARPTAVPTWS
jgi:acetyl-CoA carboxylase carboxyltransferase component